MRCELGEGRGEHGRPDRAVRPPGRRDATGAFDRGLTVLTYATVRSFCGVWR